ncbi:DNA/RNA non-specific endonuclease [Streptomyces sp. PR69]|uniref:DNA/RNA non-specific endonuclease n=1 Tax=Streptomyces sp. PR69 TaxID=2984950 RepID=UPI0022652CF3|nr:DNA/RNA non-specific endonuclease [Streptomyces sp. PR69]
MTESQAELEMDLEELRGYFQMLPSGETGEDSDVLPSPEPSTPADGGSGSDDNPCNRPRSERFRYGPTIAGAPTGAGALICPSDLKKNRTPRPRDFPEPPGWKSERDGKAWKYHRTHIIGDHFSGEWVSGNVFTGYRQMNDPSMKRCENRMASALNSGQPVLYSGVLQHGNGVDKMPTGITMTAETPTGEIFRAVYVANKPGNQVTC